MARIRRYRWHGLVALVGLLWLSATAIWPQASGTYCIGCNRGTGGAGGGGTEAEEMTFLTATGTTLIATDDGTGSHNAEEAGGYGCGFRPFGATLYETDSPLNEAAYGTLTIGTTTPWTITVTVGVADDYTLLIDCGAGPAGATGPTGPAGADGSALDIAALTAQADPDDADLMVFERDSDAGQRKITVGELKTEVADGTGTDDQTAAEVPNTPAGNIAATDVQAALNELDTEKLGTAAVGSGTANDVTCYSGTTAVGPCETGVLTHPSAGVLKFNAVTMTFTGGTFQIQDATPTTGSTKLTIRQGAVLPSGGSGDFTIENSAGSLLLAIDQSGSRFVKGSGGFIFLGTNSATHLFSPQVSSNFNHTSGEKNLFTAGISSTGLAPTSGTGTFNFMNVAGTINQTGGASGISRGLYVNPTLTAAADFRAWEVATGKTIHAPPVTIASATALVLGNADHFIVSGTTTITSISTCVAGRNIDLEFQGILTFTDGNNLNLAGDFVTSAGDTISLWCNGTNWNERARSVN